MIANRSIHDSLESTSTLNPAASAAASVAGTAVDTADSDAKMFTVTTGAYTDGTHTVTFFHREKSTDAWVQVPAADLDGYDQAGTNQLEAAGTLVISSTAKQNKIFQVGYVGGKRYVKADREAAGATTGAVLGVAVQVARQRSIGQNPLRRQWEA